VTVLNFERETPASPMSFKLVNPYGASFAAVKRGANIDPEWTAGEQRSTGQTKKGNVKRPQ